MKRTAAPNLLRPNLLRLALGAALTSAAQGGSALAQEGLSLSPTAFNINPEQTNTAQVKFQNQSPQTVRFRVEVMKWGVESGQPVYTPTRDVVANPSSFQLGPQASQVVRVGLLKKAGADELTYRVFVRQVPDESAAQSTQNGAQLNINRLISLSLPVYVTPPASAASVSFRLRAGAGGEAPLLEASNSGNRHLTLRQLTVVAGGQTLTLGSAAVLGGSTLSLPLTGLAGGVTSVDVRYQDADLQDQHATATLR